MNAKEQLLHEEIGQCFQALLQVEALYPTELDYLLAGHDDQVWNYQDWKMCISLAVDRILEKIGAGQLKRCDFDLWDQRWRKANSKKAGSERFINPQSQELRWQRGILTAITRAYRDGCIKEVDKLVDGLNGAKHYSEVRVIKNEAVSRGILNIDHERLSHNHSWVDSKRFFEAYQCASAKFPLLATGRK